MSLFSRSADAVNAGLSYFFYAPTLLNSANVGPGDDALKALLSGLVTIVLMTVTKLAGKWVDKIVNKKEDPKPVPVPVQKEPVPDSLTLNKKSDGNEKEVQEQSRP